MISLRRVHSSCLKRAVVQPAILESLRSTNEYFQKRQFGTDFHIMSTVQDSLIQIHQFTQLPWWGTIAASTVGLRLAMIPLVRRQILTSHKLAAATPEINYLYQLLSNRLLSIPKSNVVEIAQVFNVFFKGVSAAMKLNQVSVLEIVSYPLLNATIFLTFILSLRDLFEQAPGNLNLENGGLSWFTDLTEKDKSASLPFLSVLLSYSAIEIAFGTAVKGRIAILFKDTFQSILILSLPLLCGVPAGVFVYWIPNSCFSIFQTLALRNPQMMKLLRLPTPPFQKQVAQTNTQ
jgi:YidC/Oxa1 family membrane protein insertase